jgi:hypothetical protein
MNRILGSAVSVAAIAILATPSNAQIVRVGPGGAVSVRAPFVSVDTLPYGGGTRVRAPFTSVDTRLYASPFYGYGYDYGYRYAAPPGMIPAYPVPPLYATPAYPSPYGRPVYPQAIAPSYRGESSARPAAGGSLSEQLRAAAQQLSSSLAQRRDDADVWLDYLAPQRIVETIDRGGDPASLQELLRNYDGVVGSGSLGSIRASSGFSQTHELLQQFVASAAPDGTVGREPKPAPPVQRAVEPDQQPEPPAKPTPEALPLPPKPMPLPPKPTPL